MKKAYFHLIILTFFTINSINAQSIEEGLKFINMEQYGNASKTFKSLITTNPINAEYQYYLGDYYLKIAGLDTSAFELVDSAKVCFIKGKQLDPKFPLNYVGLGAVKYLQNSWDSSAIYFEQATKITKMKNAMVFFKIGEAYLYKGVKNVAVAIPQLEKAVSLDSKNTDMILALGDAYLLADKGSASRAIKQYENALRVNPKLAKGHIKGGKIYKQARNYEEAKKYFDKGIEVDPSYSPAYRERAELYFMLRGYRDKAPAEYKKYLAMSDGNYKSKFRFAYFCFSVGDYGNAVDQLKELFTLNPNDRILYRLDGYCNYEVGASTTDTVLAKQKFVAGLQSLNQFFVLTPDTTKLILSDYEYLGKLLIKTGNDSLGNYNLMKVVQKDSSRFEIYADLAKSASEKKRYKRAAELYTLYYRYKTPGANDLLTWGRAYYNADDFVMADTIFSKLVVLKPDEVLGYKWRALSNARQDKEAKTGKGVPFYEKYIEMAISKDALKYKNDIISGYTYIGKFYLNDKKIPKSKEYWKKILELDPNDPNATMVMKSLK